MLNKNDIFETLDSDIQICRHLVTKLPEDAMDYRPTKSQRSTTELLRYLSFCAIGGSHALFDGAWDRYKEWSDRCANLGRDDFDTALDWHSKALKTWFTELSDDDFDTRPATTPLGQTFTLGRALIEMPVKWMAAYRMQLYLYAKQSGNTEIWTPNCWGGVDMDRPKAPSA